MEFILVFFLMKFGEQTFQETSDIQGNKTYVMSTNLRAEITPFHFLHLCFM